MLDQNLENSTPVDNAEQQAEEHLLAGKFKSKDALIESTASLIKQVEGRDMTPTEVLNLAGKPEDELENVYKGLERQFHTNRPSSQEEDNGKDEIKEAYSLLDKWASERGYVRKEELHAQQYEENELNSYLAQNESAKERLDLIKILSKTDEFKKKSFADIDAFILDKLPQSQREVSKNMKMGNSLEGKDDWSPESIREELAKHRGATIR